MPRRRKHQRSIVSPLYLHKVKITNVRCIENLEFDLVAGGRPRKWGVIFGDNGVGKTTLLRCIAMGLCDETSASGLLREIYGEWNREVGGRLKTAKVRLEFFTPDDAVEPPYIETTITPTESGYSQVKQRAVFQSKHDKLRDFPWERVFVCGYGAARRIVNTENFDSYATVDAVYSLFNYESRLQNAELILRRIASSSNNQNGILDSIAEILMIPRGAVRLTPKGLFISGPWGDFQPIGGLGDGFQATLAWLVDLLGWAMLYDDAFPAHGVRGIVLIDELEQHLHPRWQRRIIGLLSRRFPGIQFIATTHTPMCAIGTTELADTDCELIVLEWEGQSVRAIENLQPPRRQWADQVLTSRLFQLATAGDDQVVYDIHRFNKLKTSETLTDDERQELSRLEARLNAELGTARTDFEERVRGAVAQVLRAERDKALDDAAVRFEIARQLRSLLD